MDLLSREPSLLQEPTYLIQLSLRLFFHPSDVVHRQVNPLIEPTEELPMEVCKQTPFLLQKGGNLVRTQKAEATVAAPLP